MYVPTIKCSTLFYAHSTDYDASGVGGMMGGHSLMRLG